jgi:large repetitive protein
MKSIISRIKFLFFLLPFYFIYTSSGCLPSQPEMSLLTSLLLNNKTTPAEISFRTGNSTLISENGKKADLHLSLNKRPGQAVQVTLLSSNTKEAKFVNEAGAILEQLEMNIEPQNWETVQVITVVGVDDGVVDTNQEVLISVDKITGDPDFASIDTKNIARIKLINIEKSFIGFIADKLSGNTTESGGTATFTLKLSMKPTADVTVCLVTTDPKEGVVKPVGDVKVPGNGCTDPFVTFTDTDWDKEKIITIEGLPDNVADGHVPYSIRGEAKSTDANFNGLTATLASLYNLDSGEVAGIEVSGLSGNTSENGDTATFQVRLKTKPTAGVKICLESDNPSEGVISISGSTLGSDSACTQARLEFTPDFWNIKQTVTIVGMEDDGVADGDIPYSILGTTISADALYNGTTAIFASLKNTDNDLSGFVPANLSGDTQEDGTLATFTVKLQSRPTDNVTVCLTSSNVAEGVLVVGGSVLGSDANCSQARLQFTPDNWSVNQTVTIAGIDDFSLDGDVIYSIHALGTSTDPNYNEKTTVLVNLANIDNDTAGIYSLPLVANPYYTAEYFVANPADGSLGNSISIYELRLASEPANSVDVCIHISDPVPAHPLPTPNHPEIVPVLDGGTVAASGNCAGTAAMITFTTADWNTNKQVKVKVRQDEIDDNYRSSKVSLSFRSSDTVYNRTTPIDILTVWVADDDGPEIKFTSPSSQTVSEDRTTATFQLSLNSAISSSVTVCLKSDTITEGIVLGTQGACNAGEVSFVFTDTTPQTVTVQGVDDTLPDGRKNFNITYRTISSETGYSNKIGIGITFTNMDNENLYRYTNFSSNSYVRENDDTNMETTRVCLRKSPLQLVTACISTSDPASGTIAPGGKVYQYPDPGGKCSTNEVYIMLHSVNNQNIYGDGRVTQLWSNCDNNSIIYLKRVESLISDSLHRTNQFYKINVRLFSNDPDFNGVTFTLKRTIDTSVANFQTETMDASYATLNRHVFHFAVDTNTTRTTSFRTCENSSGCTFSGTFYSNAFRGRIRLESDPLGPGQSQKVTLCFRSSNRAEGKIRITTSIFATPDPDNRCTGYDAFTIFSTAASAPNIFKYDSTRDIYIDGQNDAATDGHQPYRILMKAVSNNSTFDTGGAELVVYELTNLDDETGLVQLNEIPSVLLAYIGRETGTVFAVLTILVSVISLFWILKVKEE